MGFNQPQQLPVPGQPLGQPQFGAPQPQPASFNAPKTNQSAFKAPGMNNFYGAGSGDLRFQNDTSAMGFMKPKPTAPTEGVLSGPGYQEDWYKTHGQDLMQGPSASEKLFNAGMDASNPFYDYAEGRATKAINDASAARGNFNSSYTLRQIGDTVANLRGQQAKELGDRAGQADAAKVGRYNASEGYAGDAQRATEGRVNSAVAGTMGLANGQAGLVDNFYTKAGDISNRANMAAIEAQLKSSGLSASEVQNTMNMIMQGGAIASKFA
jgi:hypothetical protein